MTRKSKVVTKTKPAKETEALFPGIKNAKHQAVLRAYIADPSHIGAAAYKSVYPEGSKGAAAVGWSRLIKKDNFKVACDHALKSVAEAVKKAAVMGRVEVLERLTELGRSNMQDFMRAGADGQPVLDFSQLTREQAAALKEVTVEEFIDGRSDKREVRRVRFRLHDKDKPLELLGKHHGLFAEKHEHKHSHEHTIIGMMLKEIDEESRGAPVIEHQVDEGDAA